MLLLFGTLTAFSQQAKPQIEVAQKMIDLGKVAKNTKVKHTFIIKNTGSAPLLISKIKTPCGCTVMKYSKKPILVGEQAEIKVQIDTRGQEGYFHKTITLISNAEPQEFGVTFRLQIEK